ncbi:MAG: helix-turn-helix domain-containing protein, partial [Eubacterium sp.]
PFVHQSLVRLQNEIANLYELSNSLAQKLNKAVTNDTTEKIIAAIENALVDELFINQDFIEKAQLISDFMTKADSNSVRSFCNQRAINIKTFERIFLYYTSYTPKALSCISRFQNASNQLVHQHLASLTDITYQNSFTDQSHFIKDFTRFSGTTPRTFQLEKVTVKENVNYTFL